MDLPAAKDPDAETPEWKRLSPGGDTVCATGSPYSFFAREADPTKLLVFFQGGGACWSGDTCSPSHHPSYRWKVGDTDPATEGGIFELDNPDNPFADYSMVYVSYCTGDTHLGNKEVTYEVAAAGADRSEAQDRSAQPLTIHHNGRRNAMAAIEWTYANFAEADTIFVTGSSAGSMASPYFGSHFATQYPDAQLVVLGDGSGGQGSSSKVAGDPWAVMEAMDALEGYRDLTVEDFYFGQLFAVAAKHRPDMVVAQLDSAEDRVQRTVLRVDDSDSLRTLIDANHAEIAAQAPNYRWFVAAGDQHTFLPHDEFYSTRAAGVLLHDWVAGLLGPGVPENVDCGEACGAEP